MQITVTQVAENRRRHCRKRRNARVRKTTRTTCSDGLFTGNGWRDRPHRPVRAAVSRTFHDGPTTGWKFRGAESVLREGRRCPSFPSDRNAGAAEPFGGAHEKLAGDPGRRSLRAAPSSGALVRLDREWIPRDEGASLPSTFVPR